MSIRKIDRTVIRDSFTTEIDIKITRSEFESEIRRVENQISSSVTGISWKDPVNTYADLLTTYPNPQDGWTATVLDTDYTYRFNGSEWIAISANAIPLATATTDGKMSKEDFAKLQGIEIGAQKNKTPMQTLEDIKSVDGHNSGLEADLLDGKHADEFSLVGHNHDGRYYPQSTIDMMISNKADKTVATNEKNGLMSSEDKKRVDGVIHNQVASESNWVVDHNLNKFPHVTVVDSGGNVVLGDITYNTANRLTIKFSDQFSGTAYIS